MGNHVGIAVRSMKTFLLNGDTRLRLALPNYISNIKNPALPIASAFYPRLKSKEMTRKGDGDVLPPCRLCSACAEVQALMMLIAAIISRLIVNCLICIVR